MATSDSGLLCCLIRLLMRDIRTGSGGEVRRARGVARWPRWAPDALGLLWVLAAGLAVLTPALVHGTMLGPFDLLSRFGLTANAVPTFHNGNLVDQIDEFIPWTGMAWSQVHHGHLPLWNPNSALGLPLAFNWQSATFSVPALFGYLAPQRLDYTVQLIVTMVVSGTGVYVLGRVLRLGPLAAAFAGTTFELSGGFMGWFGWPVASVLSWTGWIFAATILVLRGRRRARSIAFLAVTLAAALYAGQPDAMVLLASGLCIFVIVFALLRLFSGPGPRRLWQPAADLVLAGLAGLALSAPLVLPALQLTTRAVRQAKFYSALPGHDVSHLIFVTFDGVATKGVVAPGAGSLFPDTAGYVGVIALTLAVAGFALYWRRSEVVAFGGLVIAGGVLVFLAPLISLLGHVRFLGNINWHRGFALMALGIAVLAGFGVEAVVKSPNRRGLHVWLGAGLLTSTTIIGYLWFEGRGHLAPSFAQPRKESFLWPAIDAALGFAVLAALVIVARRVTASRGSRRGSLRRAGILASVVLLAGQTGYLLTASVPIVSSSPSYFPSNADVRQLKAVVGSSIVGFGIHECVDVFGTPQLGLLQESNIAYGIHELSAYDPLMPKAYKRAWKDASGQPAFLFATIYCPAVSNLALARLYGVAFVLEPHGGTAPIGGVFDRQIGQEDLYRMPGATFATLTDAGPGRAFPPVGAPERPVTATSPGPASWRITTDATNPTVLRLRLTDVPGWHATIDGHPLLLSRFAGVMLQARIPPGRHVVALHYWPKTFDLGLLLALVCAVGLGVALWSGRQRGSRRPDRRDGRMSVPQAPTQRVAVEARSTEAS